ncbi:hypothetical protein Bbelb_153860 [Branchiostoma belcheri]|nr:hypothetical protein Bbelb_153860 [Branchiostoma belcheri]
MRRVTKFSVAQACRQQQTKWRPGGQLQKRVTNYEKCGINLLNFEGKDAGFRCKLVCGAGHVAACSGMELGEGGGGAARNTSVRFDQGNQDDSDHYQLGPPPWSTRTICLVNSAHRPGQLGPSAWSTRPIALTLISLEFVDFPQRLPFHTGITRDLYRRMAQGEADQELGAWKCIQCSQPSREEAPSMDMDVPPAAESTRLSLETDESAQPSLEHECMSDFSHETVSDVEDIHELSQQHPDDETFVEDPQVTYDTPVTTYLLVPGASQRGKGKLISSDGYSYTFKRETQTTIHWRCAVRNKNVVCPATVVQTGDVFQSGLPDHLHPAHQDAEIRAKITSEIREKAQQQIFEPASNLVDEVMEANADNPGLPSHAALIRRVNRDKSKHRPAEPQDLDFELDEEYIQEDFLVRDIDVSTATTSARHILFATPYQLRLLAQARRWYIDSTFKVVRAPFYQLFSVHAFIRSGDVIKQVPLAYAFMSSKREIDYLSVLLELQNALPADIELQECVMDFEAPAWQAFASVFPGARLKGCAFHWCQAVWRKVQEYGLQTAYREDQRVHSWVRRVMGLPFLPAAAIPPALEELRRKSAGALTTLADYVQRTWVNGRIWTPRRWSVYMQSVMQSVQRST